MAVVDEIKSRIDILDIVSQYGNLQRSGRGYRAICPFHTEKTPSFFVFPERQSWRCFGACATGGDVFSFLMRIENLDFSEALKRLAQRAGVNLAEKRGRRSDGDVLYRINESALEFFCHRLTSVETGSSARDYLRRRGLTQETNDKFQLGLSPPDGESLRHYLTSEGYTSGDMALAGVVTQGQGGDYRDTFRRRLIFPIRDEAGRLAGFGGRALDDSQPKYINSPRSPIFDKGQILYALHLATEVIRDKGVVIVEGYMDAIMAHQHGFSNVVASMGTALTQQQVSLVTGLLRRPSSQGPKDVILALDPDAAGQEATMRSLESSWNVFHATPVSRTHGTTLYERPELPSLKIAPLPEGKDPAELISENPEEWTSLLNNAVSLMDFLFKALSLRLDLSTPRGKARLAELLFPLISATPEPFQQDYYFQRLASLLGVGEATLQASLGRPRPGRTSYRDRSADRLVARRGQPGRGASQGQEAATTPFARQDHDPLEDYCLTLILLNPQLVDSLLSTSAGDGSHNESEPGATYGEPKEAYVLRLEHFRRVESREVFTNWLKCSTLDVLRETLDEELKRHLEYLLAKPLPPSDRIQREKAFGDCVRRLEERHLRELKREEELRLSEAAPEEFEEQGQEIIELNERLRRIFTR